MAVKVIMPQLGESVIEGTLTKWLKSPGDRVEEFEPLVEINTDKVDTEIPSPAAGVLLEVLVPEGSTIQAGTLMAWIGLETEEGAEEESSPIEPGSAPLAENMPSQPAVLTAASSGKFQRDNLKKGGLGFISPVVARMADEHGIDLHQVHGTGRDGRITKRDIENYLRQTRETKRNSHDLQTAAVPELAAAGRGKSPAPAGSSPSTPLEGGSLESYKLEPLTTLRKQIAEHMLRSKHTSPHVTTIMEADLQRVISHRQAHKESFSQQGVNLTFSAYFVAAAVEALKAHPRVNSTWSEEGIHLHYGIHIGLATSLGDAGLIVPVIKHADSLSLLGIARSVNDLANRARARQLLPDDVKGGTFTITNHGVSGSLFATPIINQPQCAILGVGAIQKRPVVISDDNLGDAIAIRTMVYLGLTFDHRILDGASADLFLAKLVETLQKWP